MSLAVIGATSPIAQSIARVFFDAGHDLLLVARDIESLAGFQSRQFSDVLTVDTFQSDVSSLQSVQLIAERVINSLGENPYVLVVVGSIEGEDLSKTSAEPAIQLIDVNFRNLVALITPLAEALKQKEKGCLIIVSSVAGDRGRQSNYVYGSAKAGLSAYAQGLRNRLFRYGVHVLTIKPGYVDTPMLRQALGKNYDKTPQFLIESPERVGMRIYRAAVQRKNVLYVPPIWRLVMFLIRAIPDTIFKRLRM